MYTLISGSPKVFSSNSFNFLIFISKKLDNYNLFELKKDNYIDIINSINNSSVIVYSFPLYVDSPTSLTLDFLDYLMDNKIDLNNKNVYVVINCGFREGKQNITAINIMKNWCEKTNAVYNGAILIGAGEIVGKEKYKFVSKKALKKINKFSDIIRNKECVDDIITTMDLLNNQIYCYLANKSWTKNGKKNGLKIEDLKTK